MKGLGCLIKNTSIKKDIAQILEIAAAESIENDRGFSIGAAYKFLRENKIEIDKESTAVIYEDLFDLNDGYFSSVDAVNEFALREFNQTLDNLAKIGEEGEPGVKTIGPQSPGKAAARQFVNIFNNAFITDAKTQSVMRKLQDIMYKAAMRKADKSVLPEKPKTDKKKSFDEILQDAFHWRDEVGIQRLTGGMNGAMEVLSEFKKELKAYLDGLKAAGENQEVIEAFEQYGNAIVNKWYDLLLSQKEAQDIVKDALASKGFAKTVTRNGEKVKVFDWEKLSDGTGIPDYIKDNVTEALKDKGFTTEQIRRINESLIDEYNNLTAQIIEKAANKIKEENARKAKTNLSELERRNKIQQYNQSIDAKRLARLYNLGLFEFTPMEYENLLNKMLGMSVEDMKTWNQLRVFGRALSTLYSQKFVTAAGEQVDLPEQFRKVAINSISEQIGSILRQHQNDKSLILRVARVIDGWISAGMRMVLVSTGNMIMDNPISGLFASKTADLSLFVSGTRGGKDFSKQRKAFGKAVFNDIALSRGEHYGDVSSTFYVRNGLDHLKNRVDDFVTGGEGSGSRFMQGTLSFFTGKMLLDGMDSRFKANITSKYLVHNLVKILTDTNNPNGFKTKQEALKFIAENLLGLNYQNAEKQARAIIENVNNTAGKKVLNDSNDFVTRLANDIVLANLTGYQPGLDRQVVTTEQVMAAYNSAYRAAGRDLGHVPNNLLSIAINSLSGTLTRNIDAANKEKRYTKASFLTLTQMLNKNLFNPFVGGATNWMFLTLERVGLGVVAGGFDSVQEHLDGKRARALDFGNDADMKRFEQRLYEANVKQAKYARGIVGGVSSLIVYAIAMQALKAAFDTDDDEQARKRFASWREKNLYISKYIDRLSPELLILIMSINTDQLVRYASQKWSLGRDTFSPQEKIGMAIKYAASGKPGEAAGKIGELVGGFVNAPIPWRLIRDVVDLTDGFQGEYKKPAYTSSKSLMDGYFRGGFFEWSGIRKPREKGLSRN